MQQAAQAAADTFACPSCGGKAVFSPDTQTLKCPYCGAESAIDAIMEAPEEYDIGQAPRGGDWGAPVQVIKCSGCGAETVLQQNESAAFCAFCGSPHVLADQGAAGFAPESLIPFQITGDKAAEGFRGWLKRKWFAPSAAKKAARLDKVSGVYLPHWTFDSNASAYYQGQAGHHYTVQVPHTVTRDGKTTTEMRTETRTRWVPTAGYVENFFDDVLVAGSRRLPETLLARVRPYQLESLQRYRPEFLSGFASETPSVSLDEGWQTAQQTIHNELEDMARRDILRRADEARVTRLRVSHKNVKYKLTLLPMYLSVFPFKQKQYHVLINGQTGRIGGQAPVSPLRVAAAVALGIALIALIYYFMR